jgi:hypothetical protein
MQLLLFSRHPPGSGRPASPLPGGNTVARLSKSKLGCVQTVAASTRGLRSIVGVACARLCLVLACRAGCRRCSVGLPGHGASPVLVPHTWPPARCSQKSMTGWHSQHEHALSTYEKKKLEPRWSFTRSFTRPLAACPSSSAVGAA